MTEVSQTETIATLLAEVTRLRQEVEQLKATQTQFVPAAPETTAAPALNRRRVLRRLFAGAVAAGVATMAVGTNLQTASANLHIPNPVSKVGAVILPPGGVPTSSSGPTNAPIGLVATSSTSVDLSNMPSKSTAIYSYSSGGSFGAYGVYAETYGGAPGFPSAGIYSYLNGYGDAITAQGVGQFASALDASSTSYDAIITSAGRYGIYAQGTLAPIRLIPGGASVPAASGHSAGELYVTSGGALYFFNGTAWKLITT